MRIGRPGIRMTLFLAMLGVVAMVTVTAFFDAERRLAAVHERLFEEQFAGAQRLWRAAREGQMRSFQSRSHGFARSIRLQALLRRWNEAAEGGDAADLASCGAKLYETAMTELRESLDAAAVAPGETVASVFRFVGADGHVVPPPAALPVGALDPADLDWLRGRLETLVEPGEDASGSLGGYLALASMESVRELHEANIQPVMDARDGTVLGALFIAYPLKAAGAATPAAARGAGMRSGVYLAGELFASDLAASECAAVAQLVNGALRGGAAAKGPLTVGVGGEPHRILFTVLTRSGPLPAAFQVGLFALAPRFQEERQLRTRALWSGAAALAAAAVLSGLLAHGLTVPIRRLMSAVREIGRGNLEVQVPAGGGNELRSLAASFNDMAAGLALKERYRNLLNLVADKAVAEELMRGRVALGGEIREVSVLFCDIRGFTATTLGMDPAEVVRMLNEHFTPLTREVYAHGGVVDKFVGDLIMAVFGAPTSSGHDAWNAAACALRMIAVRRELNQSSGWPIEIGIGVASGPVLAGCMGSADRMNYTVLGERVNLASRLCSKAGRMEVVLDAATRERLGAQASVTPLPAMELKGFQQPVRAFRLGSLETAADQAAPAFSLVPASAEAGAHAVPTP